MSKSYICPVCDHEGVRTVTYSETVKLGRSTLVVEGLRKIECDDCGFDSVPDDLHAHNAALIDHAIANAPSAVTPGMLRTLRLRLGVSQREASLMFGAGESSFGKWETGKPLSTPAALLVKCAIRYPLVAEYLAKLASVALKLHDGEVAPQRQPELAGAEPADAWASQAVPAGTGRLQLVKKAFLAHTPPSETRTMPRSATLRGSMPDARNESWYEMSKAAA